MQENYIQIFTTFLGTLVRDEKLSIKDSLRLLKAFAPVCDEITSRQQLVEFLEPHINTYWELKELKKQLSDPNYIFKFEV